MARPKVDKTARDRRKEMTLENHPAWLTFEDCQHLLRLHMGSGFGRDTWMTLVATGRIPGYSSPLSKQIRYKWAEVAKAVDGMMEPVKSV